LNLKRLDEAEHQLRRAIELKPDFSESYTNLGVIAYLRGNTSAAIGLFENAVRFRADNAEARFNLGRAFAREQRPDLAIAQYEAVLKIKPEDAEAHAGIAAVLAARGETRAAVMHYREALTSSPDLIGAVADLAWILATTTDASIRHPTEAVRLAEDAVRLTRSKNAVVLETLAVSYFAAGRVDEAIRTLHAAVDLAVADGEAATAEQLRARLRLYERTSRP
jgi:tetratricopeptide (TPR) repeat protein